jgi:hypothetical protein
MVGAKRLPLGSGNYFSTSVGFGMFFVGEFEVSVGFRVRISPGMPSTL